jgi:hypothetical protein
MTVNMDCCSLEHCVEVGRCSSIGCCAITLLLRFVMLQVANIAVAVKDTAQ